MRGLWGVRQSERARGGRNCADRCARARRAWRRGALGAVFGPLRVSEVGLACNIAQGHAQGLLYDVCGGRERQKSGPGT